MLFMSSVCCARKISVLLILLLGTQGCDDINSMRHFQWKLHLLENVLMVKLACETSLVAYSTGKGRNLFLLSLQIYS